MKGHNMKKILLTAALVIAMGLGANAQSDGFFNNQSDFFGVRENTNIELPSLPGQFGQSNDNPAPLGGGLLVLTALGAGYAMTKRREK